MDRGHHNAGNKSVNQVKVPWFTNDDFQRTDRK
jgi:hypothetical protein